MTGTRRHEGGWELVRRQHGVVSRRQLLDLGLSRHAIEHRLRTARLHRVHHGVYAVGRPELTRHGQRMAAVLACGPQAALSHDSAAALWAIARDRLGPIHVSTTGQARGRPGIEVHRRMTLASTSHDGIPVTTPALTLIDLASRLRRAPLEAAINEADKLDLIAAGELGDALRQVPRTPGIAMLRGILERRVHTLTDSALERRFLPLAHRAGLSRPQTQVRLDGFRVDFFWPGLGLVVETDGLRYHRTPAQQARDRLRDQVHAAAGRTALRFTHEQVTFEPSHVEATLRAVARHAASG